ncbi:Cyclin-G-associated kinase [Hondaea fermentalgiana]|uniref:non-specific serine/threonine protein kinase n=1 Tax=Hondaea fermentalgiana TaxID=2315210 RepID=A0A2R5GMX8_9STRA|nr:Cyclin-G-associated kinase [Hondaea fermentalgiana]|eukprot:GBG29661.1 Cyclin-G-associated kinase [Hondaea fermentalgiana]
MLRKFSLGGSSKRRSGSSASSSIGDPSLESPNLGTAASSGRKTLSGSGKFGGKKLLVDGSEIQIQQKLAEGGQAIIYLGRLVDGGAQYAKLANDEDPRVVVKKTAPVSKTQQDEAEAELALFKRLHSKHIARYVASDIKFTADKQGVEHPEVFLVLKYYEGGTLLDYAVKRRAHGDPLMEEEILRLMYQVARAIEHLHLQTPPVSHRDIKLENVLLDADAQNAFLCDLGSATTKSSRCETKEERQTQEELIMRSTTPLYRAPELCDLYSGNLINEQVDVWAFGCALFALGTGGHAFEGGGALAILSGRLSFPRVHGLSPAFVRLVKWVLTLDPAQRPQIGDVVDAILELCPSSQQQHSQQEAYSTHFDQPFTFTPVSSDTTLQDQFQNPSPSSSYFASQQQSDFQGYAQFATQTYGQQLDPSGGQGYSPASQYGQETLHLSNETQYQPQATTQGHHDTPPQYAQQPDQQQFFTQQNAA